jgi:AcrR family transcriptional regulator
MALYWHFKSKDELLLGLADAVLSNVRPTRRPGDSWQAQLRSMVESLVELMRAHPSLHELLQLVDKQHAPSFTRATDDALGLLAHGGFSVEEGYWVAGYLLQGAVGLVAGQPGCPTKLSPEEGVEWRRQRRLELEALPPQEFPMMVRFAGTLREDPDVERYYRFGVDLLMAGVESMSARPPRPA